MASFDGPKFRMNDGCYVYTKAIDASGALRDISPFLSQIQEDSIMNGKRVIIFDVTWDITDSLQQTGGVKFEHRLSSVKFNSKKLCLLIKLRNASHSNLKNLCRFLASKFVTFVGVQIEEDLRLLKDNHGIVIRNVTDLGKLAAKVRESPVLQCLSGPELACRIMFHDLCRLDKIQSKRDEKGLDEHLEAAVIEGWLVRETWDFLSMC